MPILTKKDVGVIQLAKKGGNDAHLVLLDEILDLEKRLNDHTERMKEELIQMYRKVEEVSKMEGPKGEKGDSGERGGPGLRGERGEKGEQGERGLPGINGRDGRDGKDGIPGARGERGFDGSPDTPEEVRDKLSSLEGGERLNVSAIDGIDERIKSSAPRSFFGGGAARAWVHQTFDVGVATTTLTLDNAVGAGGFAIFAYYQGQFIVRGTHYTMGTDAKILTLTFTPQADTAIDVVYMINKRIL